MAQVDANTVQGWIDQLNRINQQLGSDPYSNLDLGRERLRIINQIDSSGLAKRTGPGQFALTGNSAPPANSTATPTQNSGNAAPAQTTQGGTNPLYQFALPMVGPNGEQISTSNHQQVGDLLAQGYKVQRSDGSFANIESFMGGTLIDGLPINAVITGGFLPGQKEALQQAGRWHSQWDSYPVTSQDQLNPYLGQPTQGGVTGGTGGGGTGTGGTGTTGDGMTPDEYEEWLRTQGLDNIPQIGRTTLGATPQVDRNLNIPGWQEYVSGQAADLSKFYEWGDWPTMEAAQMDLDGIPNVDAMTPESFDQLEFLLSGQGFDPATMARLRSTAKGDISNAGASQRGAARLAAEHAGQTDGGGAMAMESAINRNTGDAMTDALNQIEIENAGRGLENLRMGTGMELDRRTTSSGMANQVALENANKRFTGMLQNTQNLQQAAGINTANTQAKNMARAETQAGYQADAAKGYGDSMVNRANEADFFNTTNTINRDLNQAQSDRQRDMFNVGTGEGRYGQAFNFMANAATGNPIPYYQLGQPNYQPNFIGANTIRNMGTTIRNQDI